MTTTTESITVALAGLPAIGEALAGGLFAGLTTTAAGQHYAVVLLPAKPSGRLHWQAAMDWAAEQQAELPSRPVAALLFANLKPQFEEAWHWTNEPLEDDGSDAWGQYFGNGSQGSSHKSYEGRARAVRLIHLTA